MRGTSLDEQSSCAGLGQIFRDLDQRVGHLLPSITNRQQQPILPSPTTKTDIKISRGFLDLLQMDFSSRGRGAASGQLQQRGVVRGGQGSWS